MSTLTNIVITGIGATVVMDLWGLVRQPLIGVARPAYGPVGRWVGHMWQGRFRHAAIAKAAPVAGETALGWGVHYLTGIAFAALLAALAGGEWFAQPSLMPALAVGIGTVLLPFLLMQPALGAGVAAAKTPNPAAARVQSLLTHTAFGLGLYLAALALRWLNLSFN